MKTLCSLIVASALGSFLLAFPSVLPAAELDHAKDGSGVCGYKDTPKLPWYGWRVHDCDRPAPKRINPDPRRRGSPDPATAK